MMNEHEIKKINEKLSKIPPQANFSCKENIVAWDFTEDEADYIMMNRYEEQLKRVALSKIVGTSGLLAELFGTTRCK